jgi:hypothetical protein
MLRHTPEVDQGESPTHLAGARQLRELEGRSSRSGLLLFHKANAIFNDSESAHSRSIGYARFTQMAGAKVREAPKKELCASMHLFCPHLGIRPWNDGALSLLQGHLSEFAVYGDDYDTPDGTAIRDNVHVTDLAVADVAALKLLLQGHLGGIFNLGTGNGFSVREILACIAAEVGREVPHGSSPAAPAIQPILLWLIHPPRVGTKLHTSPF